MPYPLIIHTTYRITGKLVFETDLLGDFTVICIDYEGELYTEEFYQYLEK